MQSSSKQMIATILHYSLCECFYRMGKTKNVYTTIQRVSAWSSTIIYCILMLMFYNWAIFIAFVATFDTALLITLLVPKASAAFKLQKIDWENKGWVVKGDGTMIMLIKPTKKEEVLTKPMDKEVLTKHNIDQKQ